MIKGKRGNILTETVIFISLNLIFLSILIGFLVLHTGDRGVLERNSAKEFALLIDSSEPDTNIVLNVQELIHKKDKDFPIERMIKVSEGNVHVQLAENTGSEYNFFIDAEVNVYPNRDDTSEYIIVVRKKNG